MDKKIEKILKNEINRENSVINLIASENYASEDIMTLQGSVFTNKYAEGYQGDRYYAGCKYVDQIENLAIKYVCKLFNCRYANVQPHSGSSANMAVYKALLNPGDKVLSMKLSNGGHLTHGHTASFSGKEYEIVNYTVDEKTELINYDEIKQIAVQEKPKIIIAGYSAYSRIIDFKKFKEISDSCGAYLWVDMAHIAGLIATGLHPNPFPYADVVTSTTHKTLRGPRGGIILTNDEVIAKKIDKAVFPGIQGGPLVHVIAAKAQCFYEALSPDFLEYQTQVINNVKTMEKVFKDNNYRLVSNGSDNHLLLVNVYKTLGINGKDAQDVLENINIIVNKNSIPFDTLSPKYASGIRIGASAMTTKGLKESDFKEITNIIIEALEKYKNGDDSSYLKENVKKILSRVK